MWDAVFHVAGGLAFFISSLQFPVFMIVVLFVLLLVSSALGSSKYSHVFSSFVFGKTQMDKISQMIVIPYNVSLSSAVADVCSAFPSWNYVECSLCVQNIHLYQLTLQTQSVLNLSMAQRTDIPVTFLVMYYEYLLETNNENDTVCLFGDFSSQIVHSMLWLYPFRVRMFTCRVFLSEYDTEGNRLLSLQSQFPDKLDISTNSFEQYLTNVNSVRGRKSNTPHKNICSVLYFRGSNVSASSIVDQVRRIKAAKSDNAPDNMSVIWERFDRENLFPDLSGIEWKMKGDWFTGTFRISDNDYPLRCGIAKLHNVLNPVSVWLGGVDTHGVNQLQTCDSTEKTVHFVITFTEFIFLETALGIQDALQRIGVPLDRIHVPGQLNVSSAMTLLKQKEKVIQIAVGPHQPTLLLQHYFLFHTENFESAFLDLPQYKVVMKGALGVFVYSWVHAEFVQEAYEVRPERVFVIPFYSHSPYLEETLTEQREETYAYEVYFYGTTSVRRNEFELKMSEYFNSRNVTFLSTQGILDPLFDAYDGRTKEWFIKNSRIVASIHSGGPENRIVLETHRINHLLSMGKWLRFDHYFVITIG